jgi:hypothetical protein
MAEQNGANEVLMKWKAKPGNKGGKVVSVGYSRGGPAAADWAGTAHADLQITVDAVTWFPGKGPSIPGNGRVNINLYETQARKLGALKNTSDMLDSLIRGSEVRNAFNFNFTQEGLGPTDHYQIVLQSKHAVDEALKALVGFHDHCPMDR